MDPRKIHTYWFLLIISEYAWTLWSPPRNDLIAAFKFKPHYSKLVRIWGPDHFYSNAGHFYSVFPTTSTDAVPVKVSYPTLLCFPLLCTRSDLQSSRKALPVLTDGLKGQKGWAAKSDFLFWAAQVLGETNLPDSGKFRHLYALSVMYKISVYY